MKNLKYLTAITVISVVFFVTQINATPDEQILYRQKIMGTVGVLMHILNCVEKKACALDNKDLSNVAKSITLMSEISESAFKERPDDSQTTIHHTARSEIWSEWPKFKSSLEDMIKTSEKVSILAVSDNRNEALASIEQLGRTCKSCHDRFRNK